ncbi:MAG: S1C family serine protease, partial [Steroidobacteraceae bacterium]
MPQQTQWAFPAALQPTPGQVGFDLGSTLQSVVMVHAEIPEAAFTASILGTERIGSGVVIGSDGLVLTIGYLITEATTIWLTTHDGRVVPGHALAYDQATGFGLVLPLGRLDAPAVERGSSASLGIGDDVIVMGHGGLAHSLNAKLVARREFAGYWEYVLDDALFTAPPHPEWGGTALLGTDGRLLGIGSLLTQERASGEAFDANMFVPVELLEPILHDMVRLGRPARPPRPWLGLYATELQDRLVVGSLTQGGPAHRAGVRLGDLVLEVAGTPVSSLAQLFRGIWGVGP